MEGTSGYYDITSQTTLASKLIFSSPKGREKKRNALEKLHGCLDSRKLYSSHRRLLVNENRLSTRTAEQDAVLESQEKRAQYRQPYEFITSRGSISTTNPTAHRRIKSRSNTHDMQGFFFKDFAAPDIMQSNLFQLYYFILTLTQIIKDASLCQRLRVLMT